jgi:poly(hydroxyalkanoate) depolymerase family esterase
LVLLHGCTQNPYLLEAAAGMRAIADANNFMIVYPQQNFVSSPHRCWNWYDTNNQQRDSGEPALLVGIVNEVQQTYSVDPNRTYVAGISAGGAMTSILASCYPDVFAAGAVHSGMAYKASVNVIQAITGPLSGSQVEPNAAGQEAYACSENTDRPIPVLDLHGTVDPIVVPENSHDVVEQFAQLHDLADDGDDNFSATDQPANTESQQVPDGYTYTIEDYQSDDNGLIERYVVDGLSHMWSGGTGVPPLSDPKAPNASQIFWDFLSQYSLS